MVKIICKSVIKKSLEELAYCANSLSQTSYAFLYKGHAFHMCATHPDESFCEGYNKELGKRCASKGKIEEPLLIFSRVCYAECNIPTRGCHFAKNGSAASLILLQPTPDLVVLFEEILRER